MSDDREAEIERLRHVIAQAAHELESPWGFDPKAAGGSVTYALDLAAEDDRRIAAGLRYQLLPDDERAEQEAALGELLTRMSAARRPAI